MVTNVERGASNPEQPKAGIALLLVRLGVGAMFVTVFFQNLVNGLYSASGYAGLINDYIDRGSAPAVWKAVMAQAARHASMAAPLQAIFESLLAILLLLGFLTRPVAFVAFLLLTSLWVSEWGTGWIWELLMPMIAALALSIGDAGRTWGVDAWLVKRRLTPAT